MSRLRKAGFKGIKSCTGGEPNTLIGINASV